MRCDVTRCEMRLQADESRMVDDDVVVVVDAEENEAGDLKMKEFQLVKFFETSRGCGARDFSTQKLLLMLNVVG